MSSPTAVFEHSFYIGNYMGAMLYGVELVLYFMSMQGLFRKNSPHRRHAALFGSYSTILLLLLTIDIACNAVWGEQMWITFRDQPGGVPAFIATQVSVWYQTLGSTTVVAIIFMGDALMIYRCFLIWGSSLWVIALPVLVYLGAFALAIVQLVSAGVPGGDFFGGKAINFGLPYYCMTIGMNIVLTVLICGRLLYHSRVVRGPNTEVYTNSVAIIVESALPYTLVGIMFLVPYAQGSQTSISFGQVWAKLACLSPQLILFRVITGKAYKTTQMSQSNVVFGARSGTESQGMQSSRNPYSSRGTTAVGDTSSEKWEVSKVDEDVV